MKNNIFSSFRNLNQTNTYEKFLETFIIKFKKAKILNINCTKCMLAESQDYKRREISFSKIEYFIYSKIIKINQSIDYFYCSLNENYGYLQNSIRNLILSADKLVKNRTCKPENRLSQERIRQGPMPPSIDKSENRNKPIAPKPAPRLKRSISVPTKPDIKSTVKPIWNVPTHDPIISSEYRPHLNRKPKRSNSLFSSFSAKSVNIQNIQSQLKDKIQIRRGSFPLSPTSKIFNPGKFLQQVVRTPSLKKKSLFSDSNISTTTSEEPVYSEISDTPMPNRRFYSKPFSRAQKLFTRTSFDTKKSPPIVCTSPLKLKETTIPSPVKYYPSQNPNIYRRREISNNLPALLLVQNIQKYKSASADKLLLLSKLLLTESEQSKADVQSLKTLSPVDENVNFEFEEKPPTISEEPVTKSDGTSSNLRRAQTFSFDRNGIFLFNVDITNKEFKSRSHILTSKNTKNKILLQRRPSISSQVEKLQKIPESEDESYGSGTECGSVYF